MMAGPLSPETCSGVTKSKECLINLKCSDDSRPLKETITTYLVPVVEAVCTAAPAAAPAKDDDCDVKAMKTCFAKFMMELSTAELLSKGQDSDDTMCGAAETLVSCFEDNYVNCDEDRTVTVMEFVGSVKRHFCPKVCELPRVEMCVTNALAIIGASYLGNGWVATYCDTNMLQMASDCLDEQSQACEQPLASVLIAINKFFLLPLQAKCTATTGDYLTVACAAQVAACVAPLAPGLVSADLEKTAHCVLIEEVNTCKSALTCTAGEFDLLETSLFSFITQIQSVTCSECDLKEGLVCVSDGMSMLAGSITDPDFRKNVCDNYRGFTPTKMCIEAAIKDCPAPQNDCFSSFNDLVMKPLEKLCSKQSGEKTSGEKTSGKEKSGEKKKGAWTKAVNEALHDFRDVYVEMCAGTLSEKDVKTKLLSSSKIFLTVLQLIPDALIQDRFKNIVMNFIVKISISFAVELNIGDLELPTLVIGECSSESVGECLGTLFDAIEHLSGDKKTLACGVALADTISCVSSLSAVCEEPIATLMMTLNSTLVPQLVKGCEAAAGPVAGIACSNTSDLVKVTACMKAFSTGMLDIFDAKPDGLGICKVAATAKLCIGLASSTCGGSLVTVMTQTTTALCPDVQACYKCKDKNSNDKCNVEVEYCKEDQVCETKIDTKKNKKISKKCKNRKACKTGPQAKGKKEVYCCNGTLCNAPETGYDTSVGIASSPIVASDMAHSIFGIFILNLDFMEDYDDLDNPATQKVLIEIAIQLNGKNKKFKFRIVRFFDGSLGCGYEAVKLESDTPVTPTDRASVNNLVKDSTKDGMSVGGVSASLAAEPSVTVLNPDGTVATVAAGDDPCVIFNTGSSCKNGGVCYKDENSSLPLCRCTADYEGEFCEIQTVKPIVSNANSALIIGLSVGGAILLLLIIFIVLFFCYQTRKQKSIEQPKQRYPQMPLRGAQSPPQGSMLMGDAYQGWWTNQGTMAPGYTTAPTQANYVMPQPQQGYDNTSWGYQ